MAKLLSIVLVWVLSSFLLKLFATLGIGFFTYKALTGLIDNALAQITTYMHALPASVLQLLALGGVSEALSIIGSALVVTAAIRSAKVFVGTVS